MKYELVIQFDAKSSKDFKHLLSYDARLVKKLGDSATVDGNDFGTGELNFFIFPDEPAKTFEVVRELLASDVRKYNMRAAYRERDGETYSVLWPPELTEFTVA